MLWHETAALSVVQICREVIEMADNALKAKQRAAERLARQVEVLRQQGASDKLLKRVGSCTIHYAGFVLLTNALAVEHITAYFGSLGMLAAAALALSPAYNPPHHQEQF